MAEEPLPRRVALTVVVIAYGWTWAGVLGAQALGGAAGHPLHLVGLLGPAVAVAVVVSRHRAYGRALLRRTVDPRAVPWRSWLGVAAVGLLPPLVARGAAAAAGSEVAVTSAPVALLGASAFALAAGLVEEPAWRGAAQDALGDARWLRVAVVVGLAWSLWHLPLHLLPGTYQHDLGWGTADFWLATATRVPLAVLLVALVRGARGAVVTAVVAHGLGNLAGEALPASTPVRVAELVVASAAAVVLVATWRDRSRRPAPRGHAEPRAGR
ncbi:MAG: CPBP family intramembrane metalloprotease [Actinotalea sp.]|nr:CPBP family intramembrane metalloprotease [Actinotalea sp.]